MKKYENQHFLGLQTFKLGIEKVVMVNTYPKGLPF